MREDELPEELAFRESRLEKIRDAMAALEAEAEAEQAEGKEHRGVPDDKAQRNFTDPQSRIMPALGGRDSLQGYNCQAVVDHYHQVMVAARATILASDKQQAVSMMTETINNTGLAPKEVSAAARLLLGKGDRRFTRFGLDQTFAPRFHGVSEGIHQSVVQSGGEFLRIGVAGRPGETLRRQPQVAAHQGDGVDEGRRRFVVPGRSTHGSWGGVLAARGRPG